MTFLTISPNVAMDPAITVANPIFQSGIKQAMKNRSPLIGLFTNTGWKAKMIFQFGALAFTKVCTLCSKFPQIMTNVCEKKRSPRILQEFFFRIPICEKNPPK